MKPIWIDFYNPIEPKFRFIRVALIIAGSLLFALTFTWYKQVDDEKTALIWQRDHLSQTSANTPLASINPSETEASSNQLKIADEIRHQLNTPWEKLFEGLESALTSSIKIISVTSNPSKKTIAIKASVPNIQAAISFVERLQSSDQISEVRLSNQEVDADGEEGFLQVTINAVWDPKS